MEGVPLHNTKKAMEIQGRTVSLADTAVFYSPG